MIKTDANKKVLTHTENGYDMPFLYTGDNTTDADLSNHAYLPDRTGVWIDSKYQIDKYNWCYKYENNESVDLSTINETIYPGCGINWTKIDGLCSAFDIDTTKTSNSSVFLRKQTDASVSDYLAFNNEDKCNIGVVQPIAHSTTSVSVKHLNAGTAKNDSGLQVTTSTKTIPNYSNVTIPTVKIYNPALKSYQFTLVWELNYTLATTYNEQILPSNAHKQNKMNLVMPYWAETATISQSDVEWNGYVAETMSDKLYDRISEDAEITSDNNFLDYVTANTLKAQYNNKLADNAKYFRNDYSYNKGVTQLMLSCQDNMIYHTAIFAGSTCECGIPAIAIKGCGISDNVLLGTDMILDGVRPTYFTIHSARLNICNITPL